MTTAIADSAAMSKAPRHFLDEDQPDTPIPEIDRLGDRAAIDAASEDALTRKFDDYASAAPILVAHHDWQRMRFEETYEHYVRIFTSLETLESIKQTTEAVAPSFDLLEEFELIALPADVARAGAVIGKISLYGGAVAALGGLGRASYQSYKASRALALAKGKPVGAARPPSFVASAKTASRMKAVASLGALLTVGSAAVGIIATIENTKRRMEFLRDSVESYQNWYAATRQGIDDMSAASVQMESAINDLMETLGVTTPEELEAYLGGIVQSAGELQGALKTATRMLCAAPPVTPELVVTYTGLPEATVARRAALIARNPGICQTGG